MKVTRSWGIALWLAVLLCLPWSAAEAGKSVYLSDYLALWNDGARWILDLDDDPNNPDEPDIQISLAVDAEGSMEYTACTGIYDDNAFDSNGDEAIYLSYAMGNGTITFHNLLGGDLGQAGVTVNDRQPTGKVTSLSDAFAMKLNLPRETMYGHSCLQISLLDKAHPTGNRKNPYPLLGELWVSDDPGAGIIILKLVQPDGSVKEYYQYSFLPSD